MEWMSILLNSGQWAGICGYVWHKMGQVLYQAEEPLHIVLIPRCSPLVDTSHFVGVRMYASVVNYGTRAVHFLRVKI